MTQRPAPPRPAPPSTGTPGPERTGPIHDGPPIDTIDARLLPTRLEQGLAVAGFELHGRRLLPVVRIGAGGLHGYGEAPPLPTFTGLDADATVRGVRACVDSLLGLPIERALARVHDAASELAAPVRCALDLALHDLAARLAGRPLHDRLGPLARSSLRITRAIGYHDLDATVALARRYRASGIDALKLKVGRGTERDADVVRAVRAAVGPEVELSMDANESLSTADALALVDAVRNCRPAYFEQPVARHDHAGLREVRQAGVAVMADESVFDADDVHALADADAVDLIGIKLVKSGGLTPARSVAEAAAARGLGAVVIDPLGSAISLHAGLALAATLAGPDRAHGLSAGLDVDAPYAPHHPIVGGRLAVLAGPGLGFGVAWPDREDAQR